MFKVKEYEFIKGNDNKEYCRYTLINEEGQEIVQTKLLLLEDFSINPAVSVIIKDFKKNENVNLNSINKEVLSKEIVEPIALEEEFIDTEVEVEKSDVVNTNGTITKTEDTDTWFQKNKASLAKTALVIVLITGIAFGVHSCTKEKENLVEAPIQTEANIEVEQAPINQEEVAVLTANFINDLGSKGIVLSTDEALNFIAIANIDTIMNDDEDLANELFGDKDSQELISAAGKVIGIVHTYNAKYYLKNQTTEGYIDASSVIYASKDKSKLEILEENISNVGKALKVTDIDNANVVAQGSLDAINDPTVGFIINGKKDSERLSSGAGFISAITLADTNFVGLNTWDGNGMINTINKEVEDGLVIEGNGAEYVSNIMTMIDDCQLVDTTQKVLKKQ